VIDGGGNFGLGMNYFWGKMKDLGHNGEALDDE
jgi:hypothetical protein